MFLTSLKQLDALDQTLLQSLAVLAITLLVWGTANLITAARTRFIAKRQAAAVAEQTTAACSEDDEETNDDVISPPNGRFGILLKEAQPEPPLDPKLRLRAISSVDGLVKTPEFRRHVRQSGVNVQATNQRLLLYKATKELDPVAFQTLWQKQANGYHSNEHRVPRTSVADFESKPPSRVLSAVEYVLTYGTAVALVLLCAWAGLNDWELRTEQQCALHTLSLYQLLSTFMYIFLGTSPLAWLFGGCYEHETWHYAPSAWRLVACLMLEVGYGVCTLGFGCAVSLVLRCIMRQRQCVAEWVLRVSFVLERVVLGD